VTDMGVLPVLPGLSRHPTPLRFSHDNETASPGYYGVGLGEGVYAEVTATRLVGGHRCGVNWYCIQRRGVDSGRLMADRVDSRPPSSVPRADLRQMVRPRAAAFERLTAKLVSPRFIPSPQALSLGC
jgi:hypothetical protein